MIVSERIYPPMHPIGRKWSLLRRLTHPRAAKVVMQTEAGAAWFTAPQPSLDKPFGLKATHTGSKNNVNKHV